MTAAETRTCWVSARFTEAEREALAAKARASGLTSSAYIRHRCLDEDSRARIVVDTDELKALYVGQKRIGNLANQLLRHVNTRRQDLPLLAEQAEAVLSEISQSTEQIGDFIAEARRSI